MVPVRPLPSVCLAQSDVEVEYAGGDPLRNGFDWAGTLLLAAATAVLAGAAIPLFDRRDLTT